jgi:hypothetical protein
MQVEIAIEQRHIDQGHPWNPHACPIALALGEQLGWRDSWVNVGYGQCGNGVPLTPAEGHPLPSEVVKWAERFDLGRMVVPFTFTLELPDA